MINEKAFEMAAKYTDNNIYYADTTVYDLMSVFLKRYLEECAKEDDHKRQPLPSQPNLISTKETEK